MRGVGARITGCLPRIGDARIPGMCRQTRPSECGQRDLAYVGWQRNLVHWQSCKLLPALRRQRTSARAPELMRNNDQLCSTAGPNIEYITGIETFSSRIKERKRSIPEIRTCYPSERRCNI
jgi:hypothetical protein